MGNCVQLTRWLSSSMVLRRKGIKGTNLKLFPHFFLFQLCIPPTTFPIAAWRSLSVPHTSGIGYVLHLNKCVNFSNISHFSMIGLSSPPPVWKAILASPTASNQSATHVESVGAIGLPGEGIRIISRSFSSTKFIIYIELVQHESTICFPTQGNMPPPRFLHRSIWPMLHTDRNHNRRNSMSSQMLTGIQSTVIVPFIRF